MKYLTTSFCAIALTLPTFILSNSAHAITINFDNVANGTAIDTTYAADGVTFSNPVGGSIYARTDSFGDHSVPNVVSVFQTGSPYFDARWGAVDATFSTAQQFVSIDAAILRVPEGLGSPTNYPKLEIYNTSGQFITAVAWDFVANPQPGAGGWAGYQTLSYTSSSANIGKVRLLSGQPNGSPSNFGAFDNLTFTPTVPVPAAAWLFGSGLVGLAGLARKRNAV